MRKFLTASIVFWGIGMLPVASEAAPRCPSLDLYYRVKLGKCVSKATEGEYYRPSVARPAQRVAVCLDEPCTQRHERALPGWRKAMERQEARAEP
jgi:hypothetical protein